jgi:protein SCO1
LTRIPLMGTHRAFARIILTLVCIAIAGVSCRPRSPANEKRYELKGKVVAVNVTEHTITITHEDITGYMPGMTMPFKTNDAASLNICAPGDQVAATLVVSDVSAWLEDIVITKEGVADPNAKASDGIAEPKPGDEVPDFGLINQDGKRIHLAEYRGKALALTFVYTRCPQPDQCTLMSTNFAAIDLELQKQPELYQETHLLTISFDSDYDTPKVMRSYGAGHTGRYSDETFQHWEFATGSKDEVKGVAQFFGLRYFKDTESGDEQVIHSLRTAVIDQNGKLFKLYRGNEWKPEQVAGDLKDLAAAPESPKK